ERPLGDVIFNRLKNLLGVFIAGALYFVIVQHLTNLYAAEHGAVEAFILLEGGIYTQLFWIGQVLIGSLIPLALVYHPAWGKSRTLVGLASVMVILGGIATMYVIIIGGQAFPLVLFPGQEVQSSFFDGVVNSYAPSLPEIMLGLGGVATALIVVALAVKILAFMPESLADEIIDPHHSK
ncbi:MAG: polysulfide reductase NrfD, partial [Gammaproteobacteria bacterium]|nr:polysulfide reductase NrfD [Gammaproteobacteria bacterium]